MVLDLSVRQRGCVALLRHAHTLWRQRGSSQPEGIEGS